MLYMVPFRFCQPSKPANPNLLDYSLAIVDDFFVIDGGV